MFNIPAYDTGKDYIPFHSDDEKSIVPGSNIFTVSIGQARSLVFQNIKGPLLPVPERPTFPLEHGSVHAMSQVSQLYWQHSVPQSQIRNCGPRVSLTFRRLVEVQRSSIPPIRQPAQPPPPPPPTTSTPSSNNRPKRLLFLTDSIHLPFPCEMFHDPEQLVCVKKENYELTNLHKFESEFPYTDYVFISCGVNDLSRLGETWDARNIFAYMRDLIELYSVKFPNTKFIFNSLLTTNIGRWLNIEINKLNIDLFKFSLGPVSNFWFFDSHHVALSLSNRGTRVLDPSRNGVHITFNAKREIWSVICRCITEICSEHPHAQQFWPLRDSFRRIAEHAR